MEIESSIAEKYPNRDVLYIVDSQLGLKLPNMLAIEVDESKKNLETVEYIWNFLFDHHATRQTLLVNIGGGIITDLGGFAAATYRRGIDYINIPTTLLAMVDAAVGGKTGFNYRGLKNAIGVIREPLEVIIQPEWLNTLSVTQRLNGYAELIKTALLVSPSIWHATINKIEHIDDCKALYPLIESTITYKKCVVADDLNEHGLRKKLNFGHTVGHAIEEYALQRNQPIPHGYAVMYGMVAEAYMSVVLMHFDREPLQQLAHLMVTYYGRPQCACSDYDRLLDLMRDDKKTLRHGEINCTLLRAIGDAVCDVHVEDTLIKEALDYLFSI
ncbi:MAG: 3-dehydroquinate synthase [Paludibacteraceae bacterium]|nr:3-dehydroquinate synthase [Paludibacteraceae bacterium]